MKFLIHFFLVGRDLEKFEGKECCSGICQAINESKSLCMSLRPPFCTLQFDNIDTPRRRLTNSQSQQSVPICRYGGYCRETADCVLGNSCRFLNPYYSQCLPDPSSYRNPSVTNCLIDYNRTRKCLNASQCCDPGSICNTTNHQCMQPTAQSLLCVNPSAYSHITLLPSACPSSTSTWKPSSLFPSVQKSKPTFPPTARPSVQPTGHRPSVQVTSNPSTRKPTCSNHPSVRPTSRVTTSPTFHCPSARSPPKSSNPTANPTYFPSVRPSKHPSIRPTSVPSVEPTFEPTFVPSDEPSVAPTAQTYPLLQANWQ